MNKYSVEKTANAIIYFVENNIDHLGKTKLMKLMYFTDKMHLEKYARSVFFDEYYKLARGPVANLTLNIINSVNEDECDDMKLYSDIFSKYISLDTVNDDGKKITQFIPKNPFDANLFSKSEIEVFETIVSNFKHHTKDEISQASHDLLEYKNTKLNNIISPMDMVEDKNMKQYIKYWEQEHLSFDRVAS
jgi:uncharacterized phage-associated protein